ncbi:MAG TPA: response regulator [Holophaga sp.]|nr:response regulator [Holophaga sp.]
MPKIMVIDDSVLMRKYTRGFLEEAGYAVEEFAPRSVAELMDKLLDSMPDLVISDFNMPDVDGLNVARAVKRTSRDMPIIILTANRDPARESLLQTVGVHAILHKPISGPDLLAAVGKVCSIA